MKAIRHITIFAILALSWGVLSCDSEGRPTTDATIIVPTQLTIATQPSGAISGANLSTQPVIQVLDAKLRPFAGARTEVTAEIATGGGTLVGTGTIEALDGAATFTDLRVSGVGPHTLRFTSRGLPAVTSAPITISPATVSASQLAVTTQPSGAVSGLGFTTRPIVQLQDTSGNLVISSTAPVTASLASGSGTLAGTTTVNAVSGIATFPNLRVNGLGPHTLQFDAPGLTSATSGNFDVAQSPASLRVQIQPAGATTGSVLTTQPVIEIVDNAGLVIGNSTATITATIASGGGILSGTMSVAAVGGVATFPDLRVDGQGTHVLAFAASVGVPQALSAAFAVNVGPAAKLAVAVQPGGAVSGVAFNTQPVIQVRDLANSVVTSSAITVTAAIASGTGALSGTATVNAVNGVATFSGLGITGSGSHVLTFTASGVSSANSTSFSVAATAPPASQIVITTQPNGAASGVALTSPPVVQIRDVNNVIVSSSSAPVTAAIAGGSGTLTGTTTVNAVNGVAAFGGLTITGSGTHTLTFTSPGLTAPTSNVFIVSGAGTQLAMGTQPTGAVSGAVISTQPVLQVRDASGNVATSSSAPVTAAIASGNGTLSGTTTVNAVNGVAAFSNLAVTGSGAHTLGFSSPGLTATTSASFNVTGGAATQLAMAMQPSTAVSGQTFSPQPVVHVRDAAGAVVTSSTIPVTATIASGSGTLSGTVTVNAVNGIASFTNHAIAGSGPHTVSFSSGSLTPATMNVDVSAQFVTGTKEPANFQLITQRDFASKAENNWLDRGDANFTIQIDSAAPRPDKSIGQALFPAGFGAGSGPINTYYNVPGTYRQLYFSMWIKFSANFEGQQAGVNKIVFIWIDANANVFLNAQGQGAGFLTPSINLQNNVGGAVRLSPNVVPSATFTRGVWHFWEVVLVANTVGQLDGSARWWLDGVEIGNYTNIGPSKNSSNRWEIISWNPTWGGAGGTVTNNMTQQIDYIRVSGLP